ncbi:MAG: amidohydrolase family protein [Hymenobacter sp.]
MPGLWDMHTHVYFAGTASAGTDPILPCWWRRGVTGIRDMGSDLDSILRARQAVAAHQLLGPRIVAAGPMLDGQVALPGGHRHCGPPRRAAAAVDSARRRAASISSRWHVAGAAGGVFCHHGRGQASGPGGGWSRARRQCAPPRPWPPASAPSSTLIGISEASSPDEGQYVAGGPKSPEPLAGHLRPGPRGRHHQAAGRTPGVAVPYPLLGAAASGWWMP